MGIGFWGLGIGPIPNPQSPIPNPPINYSIFSKQNNIMSITRLINKNI